MIVLNLQTKDTQVFLTPLFILKATVPLNYLHMILTTFRATAVITSTAHKRGKPNAIRNTFPNETVNEPTALR